MKKLTSIFAFLLLFSFVSTNLKAQKLVYVFGRAIYSTPVSKSFKNNFNTGFGVEGGAGIGFGKTFFTGTLAYDHFFAPKNIYNIHDASFTIIKPGIKQYVLSKILFVNVDAGVAMGKYRQDMNNTRSRFTADIGAGVSLTKLEIAATFEAIKQSSPEGFASWASLKAGWKFGL